MELSKTLKGTQAVDDWIRLFNAESEEDLKMIKARNAGIREAIGAIREMSLRRDLRYLYEEHLKRIRDRRGEDAYVRNEGREERRAEGRTEGKTLKLISLVRKKVRKNNSAEEIAEMLEEEPISIARICELIRNHPDWDDERISSELKGWEKDMNPGKFF